MSGNSSLNYTSEEGFGKSIIIGKSVFIKSLILIIEKISQSEFVSVFIEGESGTGKELVAKAIHWNSKRVHYPFVAINCAALPEPLLETELMGYAAGAFTDAKSDKKGLLEFANHGTIFLDEIGAISLSMQAKILRILEEKTIRPLGSNKNIPVDVHFISATNSRLKKRMEEGRFRKDLYYRLTTIPIYIKPLREHKEDILILAEHFLKEYNIKYNKKILQISSEANNLLMKYYWPGNIRQLRNVMERAVLISDTDCIVADHLSSELLTENVSLFLLPEQGISITEVEKDFIQQALKNAQGNQTKAAKLLGIKRDALRRRLKKYQLFTKVSF